MKVSKKAQRDAKQLYRGCLVKRLLDEKCVRTVVRELVEKKPRDYLAILAHFHRLVKLEVQRRQATVESALPLPPAMQSSVQSNLSRLYGAGLAFRFTQAPDLIGGLRIQVGSDVYDGSVRSRLDALADRL